MFFPPQIEGGLLSVRADLGGGTNFLQLPGQQVDIGQWILVSLSRHDNLFTLKVEQGGGSREVQAQLGDHREMLLHPSNLVVGKGPKTGEDAGDFQGEIQRSNTSVAHIDLSPATTTQISSSSV